MQDLISIIIPSYNSQKYIAKCLESILNQTYKNLEIIIIDDCSTDKSLEKIKIFQEDDRIILLKNQINLGQSAARNTGIKKAKGKYISFIDADDFVDVDFYEKLLKKAKETNADITMATIKLHKNADVKLFTHNEKITTNFVEKIEFLQMGSVCDKLFKANLIVDNSIIFYDGKMWEDNLFLIQAVFYSNIFASIDSTAYNYIINNFSTTKNHLKEQKRRDDSLFIALKTMEFGSKKKLNEVDLNAVISFVFHNIIQKRHLLEDDYFNEVTKILGKNKLADNHRKKLRRKSLFCISISKKKLTLFGFKIIKQ